MLKVLDLAVVKQEIDSNSNNRAKKLWDEINLQ